MRTALCLVLAISVSALVFPFAVDIGHGKQGCPKAPFELFPVGKVKKSGGITTIEICKEYKDSVLGLDQFSHVIALYWFHKNDTPEKRKTLRVHPRAKVINPRTGVFATRSPRRPNLIGLSVCRILSVENNVVRIDSIDAFHDSPVLDLKPYVPRMDAIPDASVPEWAN